MANVKELTSSEFKQFTEQDLAIVDFYAEWCMPCVMMGPVLDSLSENSKVPIAKVNIEEANELAGENQVSSIPCIIFFKNGKEVDRQVGATTEDALKEKINELNK